MAKVSEQYHSLKSWVVVFYYLMILLQTIYEKCECERKFPDHVVFIKKKKEEEKNRKVMSLKSKYVLST
jgi:hypothetical protein